MIFLWGTIVWIMCAFLTIGATIADFKGELDTNDRPPIFMLMFLAVIGPAGLLAACIFTCIGIQREIHRPFYHGFKWR